MTFQPVIPFGGLSGWSFMERTRGAQQDAFDQSAVNARNVDYFVENIGDVDTAEELVGDRRLLEVALGAFGLEADIDNKFFIRKVLEDGTLENDTLANRLADKRYLALSAAFGFGDVNPPRNKISDFGDDIVRAYLDRSFEVAVGAQSPDMRLALGLEREIAEVLDKGFSEDGMWFTVMATPPLRSVFEQAFNLPTSTGLLDVDRQLQIFKEKSEAFFGDTSLVQFSEEENLATLREQFLARTTGVDFSAGTSSGAAALTLLQSSQGNAAGLFALF